MSLTDTIVVAVVFFLFIIVTLTSLFIWHQVAPTLNATANGGVVTSFDTSINQTVSFWNASFAAIYIIISLSSVILTVFLNSNPALLVVWLLINVVTIFLWDNLNGILTIFLGTPINGGEMNLAVSFYQSGLPKFIPVLNLLIGIFLFGKNAMGGK